jgi:hypothetical protein
MFSGYGGDDLVRGCGGDDLSHVRVLGGGCGDRGRKAIRRK